jgi:hypothetical protein
MNGISYEKHAEYPYWMSVHFLHHGFGLFGNLFFLFGFLSRSKPMRTAILREISGKVHP